VENRLIAVDDERVARVVAALKTHDGMSALGKQVNNRTLALIAPLRANDYNVPAQQLTPNQKQQTESRNHEPEAETSQLIVFQLTE
jgi:hypothetical protein